MQALLLIALLGAGASDDAKEPDTFEMGVPFQSEDPVVKQTDAIAALGVSAGWFVWGVVAIVVGVGAVAAAVVTGGLGIAGAVVTNSLLLQAVVLAAAALASAVLGLVFAVVWTVVGAFAFGWARAKYRAAFARSVRAESRHHSTAPEDEEFTGSRVRAVERVKEIPAVELRMVQAAEKAMRDRGYKVPKRETGTPYAVTDWETDEFSGVPHRYKIKLAPEDGKLAVEVVCKQWLGKPADGAWQDCDQSAQPFADFGKRAAQVREDAEQSLVQ